MIEIVSRYNRTKVLYRAENAADIRQAVNEAVAARANLTGANLTGANLARANLARANLARANLTDAYLAGAYLTGANLAGADLTGANLTGAYLTRANLTRANLTRANLAGAKNFNPLRTNHLSILQFQTGKVRAFKTVDKDLCSPIQSSGKLTYTIGETVEPSSVDDDPNQQCGAGINVATLPWVLANWHTDRRLLLVEFAAKDIAAIPIGDGKFRVTKCKVVREIKPDEIGVDASGRDLVEGKQDA